MASICTTVSPSRASRRRVGDGFVLVAQRQVQRQVDVARQLQPWPRLSGDIGLWAHGTILPCLHSSPACPAPRCPPPCRQRLRLAPPPELIAQHPAAECSSLAAVGFACSSGGPHLPRTCWRCWMRATCWSLNDTQRRPGCCAKTTGGWWNCWSISAGRRVRGGRRMKVSPSGAPVAQGTWPAASAWPAPGGALASDADGPLSPALAVERSVSPTPDGEPMATRPCRPTSRTPIRPADEQRYQTGVCRQVSGGGRTHRVATPDEAVLAALTRAASSAPGSRCTGAGTFQPMRSENLRPNTACTASGSIPPDGGGCHRSLRARRPGRWRLAPPPCARWKSGPGSPGGEVVAGDTTTSSRRASGSRSSTG